MFSLKRTSYASVDQLQAKFDRLSANFTRLFTYPEKRAAFRA
jgi:hypothetical protein